MTSRMFELTENIPREDEPELHNQFIHHLKHVLGAEFMPSKKETMVIIRDNEGRTITELFGGEGEKFINLYHIFELEKH